MTAYAKMYLVMDKSSYAPKEMGSNKQRKGLRRNCRSLRFDFYYKRSQIWLEKRSGQVVLQQLADL